MASAFRWPNAGSCSLLKSVLFFDPTLVVFNSAVEKLACAFHNCLNVASRTVSGFGNQTLAEG